MNRSQWEWVVAGILRAARLPVIDPLREKGKKPGYTVQSPDGALDFGVFMSDKPIKHSPYISYPQNRITVGFKYGYGVSRYRKQTTAEAKELRQMKRVKLLVAEEVLRKRFKDVKNYGLEIVVMCS